MAEKNLDFDHVINRKNTNCLKYDFALERGRSEDLLPLWVADMDFQTSSYIQDALREQVEHGIYGYSDAKSDYTEAVAGWMKKHYDWNIQKEWIIKTPGVVFALAMAVKAFTAPGDGVLIQMPVYYPFREVIEDNERVVVSNSLRLEEDGRYHIDFEDFEEKIISEHIKLFFLCNPHNPVGRVWSKEELIQLGEICCKHDVIVISDEIHADFVFEGKHTVFASLKEDFLQRTITCTSPSKTFNLAGLQVSNIMIANENVRRAFKKQIRASGYSQLNVMGLVACEAAYRNGEAWYQAMISYIKENIAFTKQYIETYIPNVKMMEHEGTYLIWLDFRALDLSEEVLEHLIVEDAKLWLDSGRIFGISGRGFQRMNVACPRSVLEEALQRIKQAVRKQMERERIS